MLGGSMAAEAAGAGALGGPKSQAGGDTVAQDVGSTHADSGESAAGREARVGMAAGGKHVAGSGRMSIKSTARSLRGA